MNAASPRVYSIPPGVAFLPELARALIDGRLVPGFAPSGDPLALATATIYVPTRRAARELRAIFATEMGGRAALLPVIRPLGDFDEDAAWFEEAVPPFDDLDPPIDARERLLLLAPLAQAWKRRLPAHVAGMFSEPVVVPSSAAEAVWLARDLAALMDEVETQESDWARLDGLVDAELAGWWQVTLDFLRIVTEAWPQALAEMSRSNPAAHRSRLIDAETARLKLQPPPGPVIAAGSTGSIPATARLLAEIARLPMGAVVLPGLDKQLDNNAWDKLADISDTPSVVGHPQFGLRKLMSTIGVERSAVDVIGVETPALAARSALVSQAMRPAETTDLWSGGRAGVGTALAAGALDGVTILETPNERDEALAISMALRQAAAAGERAALVTPDRTLARRVATELLRFGVTVDDSAGSSLASAPPATLILALVEAAMRPGDPVTILSALKHPLLRLGEKRGQVRSAAELIELGALRGGVGRPDIAGLAALFNERISVHGGDHSPRWFRRMTDAQLKSAIEISTRLSDAVSPLSALRDEAEVSIATLARATAQALESAGRDAHGGLAALYAGEAGSKLADILRGLVASQASLSIAPADWPDVLDALIAGETVKPRHPVEGAVSIWGALEARLQHVDLIVCGGLNEGVWPGRADPGGFMSRLMKTDVGLDPPERRIGQAAHDFAMAMGQPRVVLSRAQRVSDAPSVPSRWLQRLTAYVGDEATAPMRLRGSHLLAAARHYAGDDPEQVAFAKRPEPKPPLDARPKHFSVTQIETLRRDPYAIYARKVLGLERVDDLLRDPGARERGDLFHNILHRFTDAGVDPSSPDALARLTEIARAEFDAEQLPADVDAVWWPRFVLMAPRLIEWELHHRTGKAKAVPEAVLQSREVGSTGVTLSGRADRLDMRPGDLVDVLDYKTGSTPSKGQAHTLIAPQLPLEGALLIRGALDGKRLTPAQMAYVRLRASGAVDEESILEFKRQLKSAEELSQEAWARLERLLGLYNNAGRGYLSRALPFLESDTEGDYDHLARVLEWSAGGDDGDGEGGE